MCKNILSLQLYSQSKPCPKYDEMLKKLHENPPHDVLKHLNFLKYLSRETGMNITTIYDMEYLYDTLDIEEQNGLVLPNWAKEIFPDKMYPILIRSQNLVTETPFMLKIKGGMIVTEIYKNMLKKIVGFEKRSIFIYSGHDVTIYTLMRALGMIQQIEPLPDNSATVAIELHQNDDYEVN